MADLVDLAVEAIYKIYHRAVRDDVILDQVLTHCVQKVIILKSLQYNMNFSFPVTNEPSRPTLPTDSKVG